MLEPRACSCVGLASSDVRLIKVRLVRVAGGRVELQAWRWIWRYAADRPADRVGRAKPHVVVLRVVRQHLFTKICVCTTAHDEVVSRLLGSRPLACTRIRLNWCRRPHGEVGCVLDLHQVLATILVGAVRDHELSRQGGRLKHAPGGREVVLHVGRKRAIRVGGRVSDFGKPTQPPRELSTTSAAGCQGSDRMPDVEVHVAL